MFFEPPEGQSYLYAYQNLVAGVLALIAAILAYFSTVYSTNAHVKRIRRSVLDYCVHLDQDLREELSLERKEDKKITFPGFDNFYKRMLRYKPFLLTNENLISLQGRDLTIVLRIKGILEYLFLIMEKDLATSQLHAERPDLYLDWLQLAHNHHLSVIDVALTQTEWIVGAHTGLLNRMRYNRKRS